MSNAKHKHTQKNIVNPCSQNLFGNLVILGKHVTATGPIELTE